MAHIVSVIALIIFKAESAKLIMLGFFFVCLFALVTELYFLSINRCWKPCSLCILSHLIWEAFIIHYYYKAYTIITPNLQLRKLRLREIILLEGHTTDK